MASKKEIKEHLKIALEEIGEITPWWDRDCDCWIFTHKAYPVECSGDSEEDVIHNYPIYLYDFIEERLSNNLDPLVEKNTKGKGGKRKGTKKEPTTRVSLPEDVAEWIKQPKSISHVRRILRSKKKIHR
ncbi:MAG: hypothetical protein FJZ63_00575 [Chlamydiae bacterium]|nr:hypothetical protein [Chlamydiota bacterium]